MRWSHAASTQLDAHSFTLEFLAALATWTVIDAARAWSRAFGSMRERPGVEDRRAP